MRVLRCNSVSKSFFNMQVLKEFTCEFSAGGITAIVGPNGAGKTTLVDVISGFLRSDSGVFEFEGRLLTGLRPVRISRLGITRTFQDLRIIKSMRVTDHILMAEGTDQPESVWRAFRQSEKRSKENRERR